FNRNEPTFIIKVIFARLIDDSNQLMLRRFLVWNYTINFPQLEGCGIALILHTNRESMFSFHDNLVEEILDLHFLLANSVRFIPMQLSVAFVAISQAHATNSLQLSPSSRAVLFPQLCKIVNLTGRWQLSLHSQF